MNNGGVIEEPPSFSLESFFGIITNIASYVSRVRLER
jgi:hypothetical protein